MSRHKALISVGMLVGFYALIAVIIGGLVALNVAAFNEGRVSVRMLIATPIVIFVLVRATFFVQKRFEGIPNGALITRDDQPALFDSLESIATKMGTTPPDEVYLVQDVNAFVIEDTRMMGLISKKRIMAIGLGLMNVLTVDEFESVLAHEYGHYAGSDTRLGAVTYRGWESIVRTIQGLGEGGLQELFVWYAKIYLKVTKGVSRDQERTADVWAARVGGRDAAMSALGMLPEASVMYGLLIETYVFGLAHAGARPTNMYEGLRKLAASDRRRSVVAEHLALNPPVANPYDSHPPIPERVAALATIEGSREARDDRPARELLVDPEQTERLLTQQLFRNADALVPVEWAAAGPLLRAVSEHAAAEVMSAIDSEGDPQVFLDLLVEGHHDQIVHKLNTSGKFHIRREEIGEYVAMSLPALLNGDHDWIVDWDGPRPVRCRNADEIVDALISGGEAARSAIAMHHIGVS